MGRSGDRASQSWQFPVVSTLLFTLALALRLYRLDAQSLWLDEGGTWAEVTGRTGKGWLVLLGELFSPDASYPLYHLLLKAWVSIAGDSEWALRLPSALAGALAVMVLAHITNQPPPQEPERGLQSVPSHALVSVVMSAIRAAFPVSALILMLSPFALWHAQDAKAYSMLLLAICGLIWALLRVLEEKSPVHDPTGGRVPEARQLQERWAAWLQLMCVTAISLLVHRLALLAVVGVLLALALGHRRIRIGMRIGLVMLALAGAAAGISGIMRAGGAERAFTGRGLLDPFSALWLILARFSLDRVPGDVDGYLGLPTLLWLLPTLVLMLWSLIILVRAAGQGEARAIALLCMALVPLGLLLILVMLSPIFEPRYAMVAFPGWLLVVIAAVRRGFNHDSDTGRRLKQRVPTSEQQSLNTNSARATPARHWRDLATWLRHSAIPWCIVLISVAMHFQPHKGIYSGDALKEQWREAVQEVAWRVHPDDLLLIHPYYVANMYAYYAPRVTRDRLPQPTTFPVFAQGDTCGVSDPAAIRTCWQRRYEPFFKQAAESHKRALLLIAPDHARTVDPPKSLAELRTETPVEQPLPAEGDRYGWVGLRFQYPQKTWPCGGTGDALVGVEVMCQSFPETFTEQAGVPGNIPQPTVPLEVLFGGEIQLRGFTLMPHAGVFQAGGTLPITLYWAAAQRPSHNYRMFLHLCRDCDQPPLANDDGPPLSGFAPAGLTTTWLPGDPLHDERVLRLPTNLPAGRYTLLLGVYANDQRLPIVGAAHVLEANRLVLGEIAVQR